MKNQRTVKKSKNWHFRAINFCVKKLGVAAGAWELFTTRLMFGWIYCLRFGRVLFEKKFQIRSKNGKVIFSRVLNFCENNFGNNRLCRGFSKNYSTHKNQNIGFVRIIFWRKSKGFKKRSKNTILNFWGSHYFVSKNWGSRLCRGAFHKLFCPLN